MIADHPVWDQYRMSSCLPLLAEAGSVGPLSFFH